MNFYDYFSKIYIKKLFGLLHILTQIELSEQQLE